MKKIWITSLAHNENSVKNLMTALKPYHIPVDGGFWVDDLPKMAWAGIKDSLLNPEVGLWVIIANKDSWENKSILKGLSALASMVKARRKTALPILILGDGFEVATDTLPTPLIQAKLLPISIQNLGVKILALLNSPFSYTANDYSIDFHPLNELGLWVELSPSQVWSGMILGVDSGEINFQAVGQRGTLPKKSVLEYPQQGLEIALSDKKFIAWGVQNQINYESSYFARLTELPEQLLFTPYTQDDETEAYIISFC